jgi:hypothetical protein
MNPRDGSETENGDHDATDIKVSLDAGRIAPFEPHIDVSYFDGYFNGCFDGPRVSVLFPPYMYRILKPIS